MRAECATLAPMKWTAEKPTVSGYYWYRRDELDRPCILEAWCEGNHVFFVGNAMAPALDKMDGQFLGPIHPQES